jgi:hypothetical protein
MKPNGAAAALCAMWRNVRRGWLTPAGSARYRSSAASVAELTTKDGGNSVGEKKTRPDIPAETSSGGAILHRSRAVIEDSRSGRLEHRSRTPLAKPARSPRGLSSWTHSSTGTKRLTTWVPRFRVGKWTRGTDLHRPHTSVLPLRRKLGSGADVRDGPRVWVSWAARWRGVKE